MFCVVSLSMIQRIVASIIRVISVFWRTDGRIGKFFKTETIFTPREIFPQNYISLGLTISEELGNKQTDKITDIPLLHRIDKSQFPWTAKALNVFIHTRDKNLLMAKTRVTFIYYWFSCIMRAVYPVFRQPYGRIRIFGGVY